MQFSVLGPLEVTIDGTPVPLSGAKQRVLLALLVLHANEVVSNDHLIHELWRNGPPETATVALRGLVLQLRKMLEPQRGPGREPQLLVTRPSGYLLRVDPESVDAHRFERLLDTGRRLLAEGDPGEASAVLRDALSLWRGPPLAEIDLTGPERSELLRLDELRYAALEERIEADLALRADGTLVAELESLVAEQPLRERLRAQLMLALYRSGRQADALEVYRRTRRMLSAELGIEPGVDLQRLERAILQQDPSLARPVAPVPRAALPRVRGPRSRRMIVAAAAAALAVIAAVAAVLLTQGGKSVVVAPNSLVAIDPQTNEIVSSLQLSPGIGALAVGEGAIWVANSRSRAVMRIDPDRNQAVTTIGLGIAPDAVAVGEDSVWAAEADFSQPSAGLATLTRIDPKANEPRSTRKINPPNPLRGGGEPVVAAGGGAVWVGNSDGPWVYRLDPQTLEVVARVGGVDARALAIARDAVWVVEPLDRVVTRIDPETNAVRKEIPFGAREPSSMAIGASSVWVTDLAEDTVWRIDTLKHSVVVTIPVGDGPTAIAATDDAVWVANRFARSVSRVDPTTNTVIDTIQLGQEPRGIAVGKDSIWVTVA